MQYALISAAIMAAAATFVSASPMPQGGAFASQSIPLAINLNKSFSSLSASSSCDPAKLPNACINGGFSQCVGGKFIVGTCGTLKCFALPLVNSVGTSVTCDTPEDAATRMGFANVAALNAAIGSGGGGGAAVSTPASAPASAPAAPATPAKVIAPATAPAGSIASKSIPLAIALNASFKSLSAGSPCDPAKQPNACVKGGFAQCVNGKFAVTGCAGGLKCFALPLVNSVGTSITCDTPEDAAARMGISVGQL
ncbi:hypothetical protein Q9L58_005144 [Maublancomyces gigas]|uniref:Carbohydrate-binding module family 19 domain-containing protein n=1 Tax=Discina gigas TaxID=1032678 RepID=A0ABR3GIY8_9PEZI